MSNYPQNFLSSVIAADGDKTIPPVTAEQAGSGKFSQQMGFPAETGLPLAQGGLPPDRKDFNGVLNLLSQFILWYQQGGVMSYSQSLDYEAGNEVFYNGVKYRCVQANGPSSSVVVPGNTAYWSDIASTVLYVPQTLQTAQQAQARKNIGAISEADAAALINEGVSQVHSSVTRAIGIGSSFSSPTSSSNLTVIVHCNGFGGLWASYTATYSVRINGSSVGTISLSWRNRRSGGSGHAYSASITQTGQLNVQRTITIGDTISVVRTSSTLQSVESEFAQITLSD